MPNPSKEYFGHQGPLAASAQGPRIPHEICEAIRKCLVACDSELSAQAHGRPASAASELAALYGECRRLEKTLSRLM